MCNFTPGGSRVSCLSDAYLKRVQAKLKAAVGGQAASADEVYHANPKPPTDGLLGANYTPAYAVNQVQFWHDFRPNVVEKELAAARKHFGISTLRVYLHDINFFEEKQVLMANLETFLTLCTKHGIKPGFVFFDGCHRHEGIFLDKPTEPVWPLARSFRYQPRQGNRVHRSRRPLEGLATQLRRPHRYGLLAPAAVPAGQIDALRRYTTGKSEALFFEDFETHSAQAWKPYGKQSIPVRNAAALAPGMKAVAGDEKWTDYILEGRVVIKPGDKGAEPGSAGLLLRVTNPGEGFDQMRGYAVTFNSKNLALSKIDAGSRQDLASYDLTKLETDTRINEWSMIRISAAGPRIRVWFNRMHPSVDPDRGLRIDHTDEKDPILSGAIGVRAHLAEASFDNIVALPNKELP